MEAVRDYKKEVVINFKTQERTTTGLPNSNVLYYELENDAWVCGASLRNRTQGEVLLRGERHLHGGCRREIRRPGKEVVAMINRMM